ncbi:MAG: hypothetical protein RR865_03915 [Clostridia bacterium]
MRTFRQAITSGGSRIAFGLMLLSLLGLSLPEWFASRDWGAIGQPSALQLSLQPIFFGGVSLLFPFCACTVCAPLQVDDIRSGFMALRLVRSSSLRYTLCQLAVNYTASGLCVGGAFLFHAGLCHALALPSMPEIFETHIIPFSDECVYLPWFQIAHGLPILLWVAFGMALTGGVWATVGLAVAIWIPDKLLAISIPTFLYFVLNSQTVYMLTGLRIPYAADLYNDALTVPIIMDSICYGLCLFLVSAVLYWFGVRRKALHAH